MPEVKIDKIKGVCAWDKVNRLKLSGLKKLSQAWLENLSRLNVCSEKGLCERFDSTIGRGTVEMPFGGKYQLTPTEGMVGRIPVLQRHNHTASVMACGYNP
jgi:phosphoribosylformylglycinamidine synthase